jgi:hypothetical protein
LHRAFLPSSPTRYCLSFSSRQIFHGTKWTAAKLSREFNRAAVEQRRQRRHLRGLGEFAVFYELNAYCDNPQAMVRLYTVMHQNVLDVFNEHGVQIMTPAYEGDPEKPKVVSKEQWYQTPAMLTQAPGNDRQKS